MRLTESRNARSKQLLVRPRELPTSRELLPGELLSGSEHQRPSWLLDMKYHTCVATPTKSHSHNHNCCGIIFPMQVKTNKPNWACSPSQLCRGYHNATILMFNCCNLASRKLQSLDK